MSIDTYAICPCGSGKKIKFCGKCKTSVHELDRVLKMIEGGQVVPALDRLSTILEEHPDAAWALAIRGRLLMDLREYNSLQENAERFTRLQPSNPLALTQSAAAAMFQQDLGKGTELILQALTESGQSVDSFVLDVASLLAYGLAGNGVLLTARVYATLALVSEGYEGRDMAAGVLQQINGDPAVNLLSKAVPDLIPRPADADWGERYDEAALLLSSNKVELAENKFESLQRSAALQPAVLSGLLNCAIWRGDASAQIELLGKLSQCEELSIEDRARYLATSFVVGPEADAVVVPKHTLSAEVENIDEAQMAISAQARFSELPANVLQQLKGDQEVAPRAAFQLLDRDPPETEDFPAIDTVPEAIGLVTLYGRETDRAARVQIIGLKEDDLEIAKTALGTVIPGIATTSEPEGSVPITVGAISQPGGIKVKDPITFERLQRELFDSRIIDGLAKNKLKLFGDKSLADVANDDAQKLNRLAFVRLIEGEDNLVARKPSLVADLAAIGNVEPPKPITVTGDDVEEIAGYDLNRVDPSGLEAENLIYVVQRCQQISATVGGRAASSALIEKEIPADGPMKGAKMVGYGFLMQNPISGDDAVVHLDAAKKYAEDNQIPDSSLLLAELPLRLQRGEPEAFQSCVQAIMSKYANDHEVMARLQQMLVQFGLIRPDGSPRQAPQGAPAAAPADSGGLWTPDGGGSAAAPAAAQEGGGKLWVPGMD